MVFYVYSYSCLKEDEERIMLAKNVRQKDEKALMVRKKDHEEWLVTEMAKNIIR